MITIDTKKVGDWAEAQKLLKEAPAKLEAAIKKAMDQEALYLVGEIKKKIREGPFQPLAETTIKLRILQGYKGDKPLIRTGDMRNAVTKVRTGDSIFIGIPRTARARNAAGKFMSGTKDQTNLVNLADIHERGRTFAIRMTPKMRRFLFGVLFKGLKEGPKPQGHGAGTGIIIIKIPARPFVAPVFEAEKDRIAGRVIGERIPKLLGWPPAGGGNV